MIEITFNGIVFEIIVFVLIIAGYVLYKTGRYHGKRDALQFKAQHD